MVSDKASEMAGTIVNLTIGGLGDQCLRGNPLAEKLNKEMRDDTEQQSSAICPEEPELWLLLLIARR
jgi:hypothetical protein